MSLFDSAQPEHQGNHCSSKDTKGNAHERAPQQDSDYSKRNKEDPHVEAETLVRVNIERERTSHGPRGETDVLYRLSPPGLSDNGLPERDPIMANSKGAVQGFGQRLPRRGEGARFLPITRDNPGAGA